MVNITVLHNELGNFIEEKSGFSVLIKFDHIKILFDVSYSDDIIQNSKKGNIDLNNIDYLVLSHGHIDHTEGLKFINLSDIKNVLAHPDCFQKKFFEGVGEIGCPIDLKDLKKKSNIILSKSPYWILKDKIVFLGEILRKNDFEGKNPVGYLENDEKDYVKEDSAIAIRTEKRLIIISGCSHSGICNIIEYAKHVCKQKKILAVLGGFHLFDKLSTDKTIEYFKKQDIENIYPAHCLDSYAFLQFEKIGAKRIHTLQELTF